jgi:hypothetical protein
MILLHAELGGLFPLGAKLGYISSQSLDLTGAGIFLLWRHASLPPVRVASRWTQPPSAHPAWYGETAAEPTRASCPNAIPVAPIAGAY